MKGQTAGSFIVVALIMGSAVGYFGATSSPKTATLITTRLITQNMTITTSGTKSYALVTFTVVGIDSYFVIVCRTTNASGATVTYTEQMGGPTSATTIIPPNLPSDFIVTVTTAQTFSAVVTTEYLTSQC